MVDKFLVDAIQILLDMGYTKEEVLDVLRELDEQQAAQVL